MVKAVQEFLANIGALDWIVIVVGVLLFISAAIALRHWFLQRWTEA
jgi:hypothetical protein